MFQDGICADDVTTQNISMWQLLLLSAGQFGVDKYKTLW